jgi:GT2 family glycosyltransferase
MRPESRAAETRVSPALDLPPGSVSIVVPTYNRRRVLETTLPTCLGQSGVSEVVVVDDGGTDGTWPWLRAVAASRPELRPVRLERNGGSPRARNRGLAQARGDWILLVDDDVLLGHEYMLTLVDHAQRGGFDLIAGRRIWLRPGETPVEAEARVAAEAARPVVDTRLLLFNDCALVGEDLEVPIIQAVMLVRRKVFAQVSYDLRFKGNAWREETDLQISAARAGFRVGFCPHAICYHTPKSLAGHHGGQRARSRLAYEWSVLRNNRRFLVKHRDWLAGAYPEAVNRPTWWLVVRAWWEGRFLDKTRRALGRVA